MAGNESGTTGEDVVLMAIDRVLNNLGETTKNALLWHLNRYMNINYNTIADNPELFFNALHDLLGSAASTFEDLMIRELSILCKKQLPNNVTDAIKLVKADKTAGDM